jgi:hypothetical protein
MVSDRKRILRPAMPGYGRLVEFSIEAVTARFIALFPAVLDLLLVVPDLLCVDRLRLALPSDAALLLVDWS